MLIGAALERTTGFFQVTSTISKGVATLSFDNDFQQQRAATNRHEVKHVGDGLKQGLKHMGHGLFHGITGIVSEPIKGAKADGKIGLLKGMGRGLAGAVTKPVSGVLDFAAKTSEGIQNTALLLNPEHSLSKPTRVRTARYSQSWLMLAQVAQRQKQPH